MKVTGRHNARDWSLKRAKNGDNKHTKNIFWGFLWLLSWTTPNLNLKNEVTLAYGIFKQNVTKVNKIISF